MRQAEFPLRKEENIVDGAKGFFFFIRGQPQIIRW